VAIVLALPRLYDAVVARFAAESTICENVFGWRTPAQRGATAHRIAWVPGDDGDLGRITGARSPGGVGAGARPLATLRELFTVYIEAQDATAAENERTQYQAARELFDAWWRAVYFAAHGTVSIESVRWSDAKLERRYGASLRVVCAIDAMIPDAPYTLAPAESGAQIATSELSETETTRIAAPVVAASTAPITLSGERTVDTVALLAGDRVLVKDQAAGATNGIYVVATGAWARAVDADTSGEVPAGLLVYVAAGDVNGGAEFALTTPAPIVLGTTALVFSRMTT
jgi:hypothetical protein